MLLLGRIECVGWTGWKGWMGWIGWIGWMGWTGWIGWLDSGLEGVDNGVDFWERVFWDGWLGYWDGWPKAWMGWQGWTVGVAQATPIAHPCHPFHP